MDNIQESVIVSGSGKSREEAFAKAMASIQKTVTDKVKGTVIRIEPLEVTFVEGGEMRETERFMFLFMKREVSTFALKLEVKVNIAVVDVDSFEFNRIEKRSFIKRMLAETRRTSV